jgi:hypothetical protein
MTLFLVVINLDSIRGGGYCRALAGPRACPSTQNTCCLWHHCRGRRVGCLRDRDLVERVEQILRRRFRKQQQQRTPGTEQQRLDDIALTAVPARSHPPPSRLLSLGRLPIVPLIAIRTMIVLFANFDQQVYLAGAASGRRSAFPLSCEAFLGHLRENVPRFALRHHSHRATRVVDNGF